MAQSAITQVPEQTVEQFEQVLFDLNGAVQASQERDKTIAARLEHIEKMQQVLMDQLAVRLTHVEKRVDGLDKRVNFSKWFMSFIASISAVVGGIVTWAWENFRG